MSQATINTLSIPTSPIRTAVRRELEAQSVKEFDNNGFKSEVSAIPHEDFYQSNRRVFNFSVDDTVGTLILRITDNDGSLIRQVPAEEALVLAKSLDRSHGVMVDERI